MQLEFKVSEQTLTLESKQNVVADSLNYLTCHFTFTDEWKDITKTAVFISNTDAVYNVILKDDCCEVPWEVIEAPSFRVSVFGGNRITTTVLAVNVSESGYIEGETPEEPTPDVYQQILESMGGGYVVSSGRGTSIELTNCLNDATLVKLEFEGQSSQGDNPTPLSPKPFAHTETIGLEISNKDDYRYICGAWSFGEFPLTSVGEAKDRLVMDGNEGIVKIIRECGVHTVTEEDLTMFSYDSNGVGFAFNYLPDRATGAGTMLMSKFPEGTWTDTRDYFFVPDDTIMIKNAHAVSEEEWKGALLGMQMVYKLASPIEEDITNSNFGQQLLSLYTVESCTANALPACYVEYKANISDVVASLQEDVGDIGVALDTIISIQNSLGVE